MLMINRVESVYPAPAEDEDDYCPDAVSDLVQETVSFRELVELMRSHNQPSCYPAQGCTFEWLSAETQQDYRTGEYTETSIHYARENPPRCAKYWKAAMKAAGILR